LAYQHNGNSPNNIRLCQKERVAGISGL